MFKYFWSIPTSNSFDACYGIACIYILFQLGIGAALSIWFLHFLFAKPREPGKQ